ncbi:MAG: trypsin-like peptidase domain-containing protein [Flavobacteriales bacterium]|nr:trypsin-like peptidase domain-containing protein [Flavobacteriales bacterium]MCB9363563.1 trypsin-like peptidase domain-containing protein [Flavobacteriales bacterium]
MKHLTFLISIILLTSLSSLKAQSYTNWEIILDEQFDNNNNKWTTSNTEERKASVISGKLIDEYNKDGFVISNTIPTNFDDTKDYRIKFSLANLNYGYKLKRENIFPVYGFVWSFKDWKNYNYILLQQGYHSNGYSSKLVTYYKIGSYIDGNEIIHVDWKKGSLLSELKTETSFNEITMVKSGKRISFYYGNCSFDFQYNNSYLGYCSSEKWFSNRCGIYVSNGSKILLDYLTIEQEKPKVNSNIQSDPKESELISKSGSGIILSQNGYFATNYHVVDNAEHIEVDIFKNGVKETYLADIINSDKLNDLSLLKIRDANFKTENIPFGVKPFGVKVGEDAFALGYPKISLQGEEVKVTNGIISSKTGFQNDPTTYQISVPIQPGNSGGPLFDKNGNLIGITNAGIPSGENVGYAIKISYLLNFIETQPSIPSLPNQSSLIGKSLPDMIEKLSPFTVLIRVNDVTIESKKTKSNTIINGGFKVDNYTELKRNSTSGEYETISEIKLGSSFYFTSDYIFFKKGTNKWLVNKWTYDGFDEKSQNHYFYDDFGQTIVINKDLNQLAFWSEREGDFFNKVYLYSYLTKDDSVQPEIGKEE